MIYVKTTNHFTSRKILSLKDAKGSISELKKEGKKVGLCNGGYDLLHPGHIKHFESAKKLCDVLFASITSDRFVTERKGTGRPIFTEELRAYSVAALEFVDYVVISDFRLATDLICSLKPSFYIKGPDFIHKTTPGITAEKKAIKDVGGELRCTKDPTLSTTKIIDYIKQEIARDKILLIIDRDGTIVEDTDFLGKNDNWKNDLKLNKNVVDFLSNIQTKLNVINMVITNQAGVARGYFNCTQVENINSFIDDLLKKNHITIHNWQYCPDVDKDHAENTPGIRFKKEFVKQKTKRKPSIDMVFDGLKELKMELKEFTSIIAIGDRHEDEGLAKKLNAQYINVKEKSCNELIEEFELKIKK